MALNSQQQETLRSIVQQPRWQQLRQSRNAIGLWHAISAPAETSEENTEPQGTVVASVPLESITSTLTLAEKSDLLDPSNTITAAGALIAAQDPQNPTAVAAASDVLDWLAAHEIMDGRTTVVFRAMMAAEDLEALEKLLAIQIAIGRLSTEAAAVIQSAIMVPDPDWQATIHAFGPSLVEQAGLPTITADDVLQLI